MSTQLTLAWFEFMKTQKNKLDDKHSKLLVWKCLYLLLLISFLHQMVADK